MMKISNRKILALLLVMLMSGSGGVYAANAGNRTVSRVPRPNMTKNVRAPRPVQTGNNTSARSTNTTARTVQPKEVLYAMIGNPLKSQIPVYTSLTSGKVARYFNVSEVGHGEDNAYFLDIYIYNNGYAEATYFDKQYKDRKIYVKASDLSTGSGVFRVNNLPVQTASASTPLYTDASKSKVMYTMEPGRTYKVLAQQGNMQQVYSYGKGQYSAIGWISIASSSNGGSNGSRISSTGLRGDINGDGQVNSNDLALLKQYLNNSSVTINKADADMNNDKKFTTTDLSQLRSKVQVTPADTYTVFTIPNGWYEIAPIADGNMRLDVDDGREGNGVTIKLFTRNGHAAQRFLVNNVGNGYFTMRTGCNGYVDLEYGRTANGSRICQYEKEADNEKCQKFRAIRRNNEAAVYLEPILQPGLAITCANHSTAAETKVVIWSRENSNYQKWQFIKTNGVLLPVSVKEGLYSLQPMCAPNTELTVSGASKNLSAPVVIDSQNSANQTTKSHQKWYVTSVGNGYYKITAENSGLALNNHNGANVNGNPITIYTYSGYCQEFRFYDSGNGYYIIQPKNVSGVLDVAGGGNANNTRVQLYQYNGSAAQKWKLVSRQRGVDPDPYKQWEAYPKRTCNVYTDSALTKRTPGVNEYVDTSDPVTVLGETSNAYYIRYKARSGYKDRWVTKDIFKERINSENISPSGYYYPLGKKSYFKNADKNNGNRNHDCMQGEGTPVYAACDGTVEFCQIMGTYNGKYTTVSYGNVIYLTGSGVKFTYAHLSRFEGVTLKYSSGKAWGSTYTKVKNRKKYTIATKHVKAGELIGYVGTTGNSSGAHLHLEIYVNGVRKEPNDYFNR